MKLLGDHTPQALLDSMVYLCGIHFALRSGAEHRSLLITQLQLSQSADQPACLIYTENFSKNNAGGIAHRKLQPKRVIHHANTDNPSRCLVRLYESYVKHWPKERKTNAFYLTPLKKPREDGVWYSSTPVGHNPLSQTVKRLCQAAGISGFKTNHSLRVTSATRLFQSGTDEQLIMSRTGHRSVEGVRAYKRVGDEQRKELSEILNSATNGIPETKKRKICNETSTAVQSSSDIASSSSTSSSSNTAVATYVASSSSPSLVPTLNITGCTTVNININQKD